VCTQVEITDVVLAEQQVAHMHAEQAALLQEILPRQVIDHLLFRKEAAAAASAAAAVAARAGAGASKGTCTAASPRPAADSAPSGGTRQRQMCGSRSANSLSAMVATTGTDPRHVSAGVETGRSGGTSMRSVESWHAASIEGFSFSSGRTPTRPGLSGATHDPLLLIPGGAKEQQLFDPPSSLMLTHDTNGLSRLSFAGTLLGPPPSSDNVAATIASFMLTSADRTSSRPLGSSSGMPAPAQQQALVQPDQPTVANSGTVSPASLAMLMSAIFPQSAQLAVGRTSQSYRQVGQVAAAGMPGRCRRSKARRSSVAAPCSQRHSASEYSEAFAGALANCSSGGRVEPAVDGGRCGSAGGNSVACSSPPHALLPQPAHFRSQRRSLPGPNLFSALDQNQLELRGPTCSIEAPHTTPLTSQPVSPATVPFVSVDCTSGARGNSCGSGGAADGGAASQPQVWLTQQDVMSLATFHPEVTIL
jgi:hypothetical protein